MRKKVIVINSDKDYKKLLRKINVYKSILFYNTFFCVENNINEEMIDYIINALNIKKRKERICYIYDTSCKFIDSNSIGICGFKDGKCYLQQEKNDGKCNGCCRKCMYQTNKGCSTSNISCKLFNCSHVTSRHKVIEYKDLKILKVLSLKNRFIIKSDYFSKREDVLKDLYTLTLFYAALRIIYRNFYKKLQQIN